MAIPFGDRARCGNDETCVRGRGLERLRAPCIERALHARSVRRTAEQCDQTRAMVRQDRVQPYPAAVAAAIKAADIVPDLVRRLAVDRDVMLAAKLDGRAPH